MLSMISLIHFINIMKNKNYTYRMLKVLKPNVSGSQSGVM